MIEQKVAQIMLTEFFLERARIELSANGMSYSGSVPELPEIHIEAATPEQCHSKLAEAIKNLLANEVATNYQLRGNERRKRYTN